MCNTHVCTVQYKCYLLMYIQTHLLHSPIAQTHTHLMNRLYNTYKHGLYNKHTLYMYYCSSEMICCAYLELRRGEAEMSDGMCENATITPL